jgi:hypothetical protein
VCNTNTGKSLALLQLPVVYLREVRELDGQWRDSIDCGSRLPRVFPAKTPASAMDFWIFAM